MNYSKPPNRPRPIAVACCVIVQFLVVVPSSRADDEVTYFDRATKKEARATGTIQSESPAQIILKSGMTQQRILAIDVIDIAYEVSPVFKVDYRTARGRELAGESAVQSGARKQESGDAISRYQRLHKAVTNDRAKRHLEFRIASATAIQAADDASTKDAVDAFRRFQRAHSQAWQRCHATDLLAGLLVRIGDVDSAKQAYEDLAVTPDLPPEMQSDVDVKIARLLIDSKRLDEANQRIQALSQKAGSDARHAIHVRLLSAECDAALGKMDDAQKRLGDIIGEVTDSDLKAVVYNTLGDCHRMANRPRDAMWAYLWVDVIYHSNRHEHARALYRLVKLFQEFKEEKRAQQFRDKLAGSAYAGLEFQRKLLTEK